MEEHKIGTCNEEQGLKDFEKKQCKKEGKKERGKNVFFLYRLRRSRMNATPIATISVISSNPGTPPALMVTVNVPSL